MAGLRAGAALGPPELVARLAPSGGISAPAQAAATWAVSDAGVEVARRRRAAAAALHERLAAALAGSPLSAAPGSVPFAWISSDEEDGAAIATRLAKAQVFVAPGSLWGDERHVRAALRGAARGGSVGAGVDGGLSALQRRIEGRVEAAAALAIRRDCRLDHLCGGQLDNFPALPS